MPKYLKLFETHQEYETYLGGGDDTSQRVTLH